MISSNTAEYYKLKINDKIQVTKENGERISLLVKGIVKNYVCHFIVISPEYYKKAMNEEVKNNIYFIKINGTKRAMLRDAVKGEDGMLLIVVLNLLVMYINEKSKTLAVMRINGYTIVITTIANRKINNLELTGLNCFD